MARVTLPVNDSSNDGRLDRREFLKKTAAAAALVAAPQWALPSLAAAADPPVSPVAIRRCTGYDPALIYNTMAQMFSDLGGISSLVFGKNVAIKANCVSMGNYVHSMAPQYAQTTHPEVVYAACRLFIEAGATTVRVMESFQTLNPLSSMLPGLGYDEARFNALGNGNQVRFYSTRNKDLDGPNPDSGFDAYGRVDTTSTGVGSGDPYMFDYFYFNKMWLPGKSDVVVSIAKMKGHAVGGVTLCIKNMFGCTPPTIYGGPNRIDFTTGPNESATQARNPSCHMGIDWTPVGERTGHGVANVAAERIPRLLADLSRALPVHLGIIDGITGMQGEMGPNLVSTVTTPMVLLAGFNPVCVDAVGAGVMGGNPQAAAGTDLWPSGQNHIALCAAKGIGSNDLSKIPIVGNSIASVRYDYYPTNSLGSENPMI